MLSLEISIYALLLWQPVTKPLTVWNSSSLDSDVFCSMEMVAVGMGKPVENKLSSVFSALIFVLLLAYGMLGCLRVVKRFCMVLKSSIDGFWGSTFTSFLISCGFCILVVNKFCMVLKSSKLGAVLMGSSVVGMD